jgi:hypothetical protein
MTRSTAVLRFTIAALAAGSVPLSVIAAQEPSYADGRVQDDELYTAQELDNLLAPVALYPDPILAQLFVAATYPEQIELAARYVSAYGVDGVDDQAWDVSVRSIARYEPVLNMLAERPNWATAVGRAYAQQPGDVMSSVQTLRRMAREQGNLVSTDQQRIEVEREYIRIVPAQPRVVYVPVYDPYVVYYRPVNYVRVSTPYWSFGIGYPIGVWLNYDLDWDTRVVYYHGWNGYGRRHTWYHVSRPYIVVNNIYVGPRFTTVVVINRGIRHRHVNYGGFGYYNTVHRSTRWDRARLPGRGYASRPGGRAPQQDRYGVPSRTGSTYRPDKGRDDRTVVPRVGGTAPSRNDGNGGRPSRGNGNNGGNGNAGNGRNNGGNGNGGNVAGGRTNGRGGNDDRVSPVRVGGNSRPLYPRGEDISADRVRGGSTVARRETNGGNTSNGTWNARPQSERAAPRSSGQARVTPNTRGRDADPVRAPRGGAERVSSARPERSSAPSYERSTPRSTPRSEPRYEGSSPRAERSSAPRTAPRASTSQSRSSSAPRSSEPRMSAPRSSEPRASAPRSSAPRASAPRESRGSGGGGQAPRASRGNGGGRDRG